MKILISGAGVAGPTLAYWLHRGGHQPTIIEKAPQFRTGGFIIDFWGVGYQVAERMGILPALHAAGYSVRELRFVDGRGRRAGGVSADTFRRIAKVEFTSLPRGDLACTVYRTVENQVEFLFDNTIAGLEEHPSGVRASFAQGAARDFELVIGADGLHSRVRGLVFGPQREFEQKLGYHVAAFECAGYRPRDERVYVSYAEPGRHVSRFALRGDRTLFLLVFRDQYIGGAEPEELPARKSLLQQIFNNAGWECSQMLRAMDQAPEIYFDRVSQIRMPAWSKGRVMLIGDAAFCVSLLAGEGTGLAMTAAYVLAGELSRAGPDYQAAFCRHERRLRPFIERRQKSARNFASSFAPKTRLGVWFRNQVTKLFAIPAVASFFIGRDMRDDFNLPEYNL